MKPFVLLIGALAFALSGCAASAAAFGPQTGTVAGHVFIRACGGAARLPSLEGQPCTPRPDPGVAVTLEPQAGGPALNATTDSAGAYSIKVRVGTYTVHLGLSGVGKRPPLPAGASGAFADRATGTNLLGPKAVTVSADKTVTADFTIVFNLL